MEIRSGIAIASVSTIRPHGAAETGATERQALGAELAQSAQADGPTELTLEEQRVVQSLRQRDQEVHAHEQAHAAAGGPYVTGAPSYEYQTGPDGRQYAVGGEVGIDTSRLPDDPSAMLEKARTVLQAALAPSDPSSQDLRVAADARAMEVEATRALREMERIERERLVEEAATPADFVDRLDGRSKPVSERQSTGQDEFTSAQQGLTKRIDGLFAAPRASRINQYA